MIFLIASACFSGYAEGEDNILLWCFDDPEITEIGGGKVWAEDLTLRGTGTQYDGQTANAVRVKAIDSDGMVTYLNLTSVWKDESGVTHTGAWAGWMGLPDEDYNMYVAGPGFASLSGLNLSDSGLSFAMEIGYATFDEGQISEWYVMAAGFDTITTMKENAHIYASELGYQQGFEWGGGAMTVPEPTSGMLVLIGGALLALRRRRKDLAA